MCVCVWVELGVCFYVYAEKEPKKKKNNIPSMYLLIIFLHIISLVCIINHIRKIIFASVDKRKTKSSYMDLRFKCSQILISCLLLHGIWSSVLSKIYLDTLENKIRRNKTNEEKGSIISLFVLPNDKGSSTRQITK